MPRLPPPVASALLPLLLLLLQAALAVSVLLLHPLHLLLPRPQEGLVVLVHQLPLRLLRPPLRPLVGPEASALLQLPRRPRLLLQVRLQPHPAFPLAVHRQLLLLPPRLLRLQVGLVLG